MFRACSDYVQGKYVQGNYAQGVIKVCSCSGCVQGVLRVIMSRACSEYVQGDCVQCN